MTLNLYIWKMKVQRSVLVFVLLFFFIQSSADKLEKGFEKLKLYDYFNAKRYFEKSFDNEPAASAYGLALIFSTNNNPFYNSDSARKYILISDSLFPKLKERIKKYYGELGITDRKSTRLNSSHSQI